MDAESTQSPGLMGSTAPGSKKKGKKRIRNFTREDRAAHRVFEKSRREAFNESLLVSTKQGVLQSTIGSSLCAIELVSILTSPSLP